MGKNRFVEQGKASKPSTPVNAAETAEQEAKARLAASASASASVTTADAPSVESVKTELESALSRLGFKTAIESVAHELATESVAVIEIKSDSIARLYQVKTASGNTESLIAGVGVLGVNASTMAVIVSVDRQKVLTLGAPTAKVARVGVANGGYTKVEIYSGNAGVGVNQPNTGEINRDSGIGVITLSTGLQIPVSTGDSQVLTGKAPKNGKAREYVFCAVATADSKVELLASAWLPGLMNMIKARKALITHAASAEQLASMYQLLESGTGELATADADADSVTTDADAEHATAE